MRRLSPLAMGLAISLAMAACSKSPEEAKAPEALRPSPLPPPRPHRRPTAPQSMPQLPAPTAQPRTKSAMRGAARQKS